MNWKEFVNTYKKKIPSRVGEHLEYVSAGFTTRENLKDKLPIPEHIEKICVDVWGFGIWGLSRDMGFIYYRSLCLINPRSKATMYLNIVYDCDEPEDDWDFNKVVFWVSQASKLQKERTWHSKFCDNYTKGNETWHGLRREVYQQIRDKISRSTEEERFPDLPWPITRVDYIKDAKGKLVFEEKTDEDEFGWVSMFEHGCTYRNYV